MTADDEANRAANVDGTRHAVELANALKVGCFHQVSSVAAAGLYEGVFTEDMFDEGQPLDHPYHRTKFESEKIARTETKVPWRVYRPGDRRRPLADRRDGQDRRPVLPLQGAKMGARLPRDRAADRPADGRDEHRAGRLRRRRARPHRARAGPRRQGVPPRQPRAAGLGRSDQHLRQGRRRAAR